MNFNATGAPGYLPSSDVAVWIIAISLLISTVLSVLSFMGYAQSVQVRFWKRQIESKLRVLEAYARSSSERARKYLEEIGVEKPDELVNVVIEYFTIDPVDKEPTDIIRRLERVIRTEEERIEQMVNKAAPQVSDYHKKIAVTLLGIANALNMVYKYVRHLLLWGLKMNNPLVIAQLWMQLQTIINIVKAYHEASAVISEGKPIGDAAGPLLAYKLMRSLRRIEGPKEIDKDTVYSVHELEGREVIIVKAKGPGSTVGRPGSAVEKLAEAYKDKLSLIITVDAAVKYEGEDTGLVAEGAGVAMGDPGPEKIRIERVACRLGIPLHAVIIKMGFEEAVSTIKREVVEGVDKALEVVKKLILERVPEGRAVIVVGVGNTLGVAQ